MNRYICIHGHFYQPPRENPWLEAVELQDAVYPYHDWNAKITEECYAPNASSRILDDQDRILQVVNNYSKISFNFGPTLLAWLEEQSPQVYEAILEGDRESQKHFSGHGSALAQPYNHTIMPLANRRDKTTQILWGIRDFEHRFGRAPEGMWLPETAVDLETLDIMSQAGIRFTILAPHQAKRVKQEDGAWEDLNGGIVDTTVPYRIALPSGRESALFFYDGPLSRAVAFEGLLRNGESFAKRLVGAFTDDRPTGQLVHIATDGESYGHHHRFGDMALAYAIHYIESNRLATVTNYGEFLETHPPKQWVEIQENTSWSCAHGVERWRSDCGCHTGANPHWRQPWRKPLREALDWLRDAVSPLFEKGAAALVADPWEARNQYIHVVLRRTPKAIHSFFAQEGKQSLGENDRTTALKLLELQRHAMLMYTSCGWFFDDLSGIETIQILRYAGRVLQLAEELDGIQLEPTFLEILSRATSNLSGYGGGDAIYERLVRPAVVDLKKVAAHYAISSLFEDYEKETDIYCYRVRQEKYDFQEAGKAKLAVGRATVVSEITRESGTFFFGVLHLGDHNLSCGVAPFQKKGQREELARELSSAFGRADFAEVFRILEMRFGRDQYTLRDLFHDEQRKILDTIMAATVEDAEASYRQIYEYHVPLMRFLKDVGIPAPKAMYEAAELVLNANLRRVFQEDPLDGDLARSILDEIRMEGVTIDTPTLELVVRRKVESLAEEMLAAPKSLPPLVSLDEALDVVRMLPFTVNLWTVQNIYYELLMNYYPNVKEREAHGDSVTQEWVNRFVAVGKKLSFRMEYAGASATDAAPSQRQTMG